MNLNRRKFIKRLIAAVVSIEAFFLIKNGISTKTPLTEEEKLISVGNAELFMNNKTYPFVTNHFYLRRFKDGGFMAFSVKCTHLGCVVNINSNTGGFNCPCHASQFNEFGDVISSPATRPLDTYPIIVKNNELWVDITKATTRTTFDKSQLTYI
ncbi:ubiquinol-cytochrome c reductase iron-sulfur subunit [Plebeiibacterium sediminum]|uniref:Rieske (2Fe-2S) protein n=1 Tax=Plebeiibacterium sediminum TaxID=2992112 RepID=A0AAE3SFL7_9BACT|nr:Rieske (2Fe-2S) protein [Plebeiobacterium sediminum]MCW3787573.1 Rieske (2Fe-2S) protein [Plebeiobacterium sediminum]